MACTTRPASIRRCIGLCRKHSKARTESVTARLGARALVRRACRERGHVRRVWGFGAGQIAILSGPAPTVMVADTASVAVVITDTVPSVLLET